MESRSLTKLLMDKLSFQAFSVLRRAAATSGGFKGIVVPVDDLIGHHIMATGRFESTQFDGLSGILAMPAFAARAQEGRFVDVGANIGLYSLAFSDRFRSTVAVEANPQTYLVLVANLALSGKERVTPVCLGASNRTGEAAIHVPTNGNLGWATLDADHHTIPVKSLAITVKPLDAILRDHPGPPVTLLKIDVEGHERNVLEGATGTLTTDGPVVLFEVLDKAAGDASARLLQDCGYRHFYTFKRDWPPGGTLAARVGRGFRSGLPVTIRAADPADLASAALICAARSALA